MVRRKREQRRLLLFSAGLATAGLVAATAALLAIQRGRPRAPSAVRASGEEEWAEKAGPIEVYPLMATLSAYWHVGPEASAAERRMEGGDVDTRDRRLYSLQEYLSGNAPYVSVAADPSAFPYGTELRIHELEERYGRRIVFRVVDTGDAFKGKGTRRLDIRVSTKAEGLKPEVNGTVHYASLGRARERLVA